MIHEPGSEWARELWVDFPRKIASRMAYVETRAALASAVRNGRISPYEAEAVCTEFDEIWSDLEIVEAGDEVVSRAAILANAHVLRGYDAVQLASALAIRSAKDDVLMITWDDELARAAHEVGISVVRTIER